MEKLRKDLEKARSLIKESADRVDWQLPKHRLYKVEDGIVEVLNFFKREEMKQEEVVITVSGGVAEVHSRPKGVKVKIVDFDCEGAEEDLIEKFNGDDAIISEYDAK